MIRAGDAVILLLVASLIGGLGWHTYSDARVDHVRVAHGRASETFPAWQDRVIRVSGPLGETVVEIANGQARVLRSPCSNKLCLRAGWLLAAGEATACLPNRVSVALLGDDPRFDAMNF